ncbi:ankyrin repeat-containing domain protein [Scenedesmus sp. NREL 46B-D3]|nr:ankyrin repeat-containing domain protein [Scenedesmus sp. NREL 46B-D3]
MPAGRHTEGGHCSHHRCCCCSAVAKHAADMAWQLPAAASTGDLQAVQQLLDQRTAHDADAAAAAAYLAALNGQLSVMRVLLQHGVFSHCRGGPAPLHAAALRGHTEAVQLLLDTGAQPGCKAEDGITALHAVAQLQTIRRRRASPLCTMQQAKATATSWRCCCRVAQQWTAGRTTARPRCMTRR